MAWHFDASPQGQRLFRTFGEDESSLRHISGGPSIAMTWNKRSPGLPMLINDLHLFEYGGLHFAYLLDAYGVDRGALHFSYILGGIVEADSSSSGTATTDSVPNVEYENPAAVSSGASTSAASATRDVSKTADSTGVATGAMVANLTLEALAASTVSAMAFFSYASKDYPAWSLNLETLAPVRYSNFNFNSFAKIRGYDFGAGADGLFQLGGETDNGTPIEASIMLGRDMRKTPQVKRSNRAYLHGTSDNKMEVRIVGDDGVVYTYKSELSLSDIIGVQRVVLGRGLSANYWQIEVRNIDGGKLELERIEFLTLNSSRKIKR